MLASWWCCKSAMLRLIGPFCCDVFCRGGFGSLDGLFCVLHGRNKTNVKEDKFANQSAVQAKFGSKTVCSIICIPLSCELLIVWSNCNLDLLLSSQGTVMLPSPLPLSPPLQNDCSCTFTYLCLFSPA